MGLFELDSCNSSSFQVNRPLLNLKWCYFIVYSAWFAVFPYVALISAQIIDYKELAIIYACIPATSVFGPVVTGFIADKIGSYKAILTSTLLLSIFAYLPVWWLETEHREGILTHRNETNHSSSNSTLVDHTFEPNSYTFPILLVARLLGFYTFDSTNFLLDACCTTMTKKHGGDFARQKLFSMASMAVIPIVVGVLIDKISEYRGFKDFSIAFYLSTSLTLAISFFIYKLDVDVEKNKHSFISTAKKIVGMIDVNVFFLAQVVCGVCSGWHRSFFPVYIDMELQDSKTFFGAAYSLSGVGSMILFWTAKIIIGKFGPPTTVMISLLVTFFRFSIYYFLSNPWIIAINEAFEGTSGFLSLVAGNYFCGLVAPKGMLASFNGLLAASVFGLGRGLGLTVGSIMMSAYGIRITYLAFGALAGVTSLTYLISYHLFLKKIEHQRFSSSDQKPKESVASSENNESMVVQMTERSMT